MGYTKPTETTRTYLESQPLPTHGKSYTVIPHARVIDTTLKMLNDSRVSIDSRIENLQHSEHISYKSTRKVSRCR